MVRCAAFSLLIVGFRQDELDAMRQVETQLAEKQAVIEEEVRSPVVEDSSGAVSPVLGGDEVKALREEMHAHMARLSRERDAGDAALRANIEDLDQKIQAMPRTVALSSTTVQSQPEGGSETGLSVPRPPALQLEVALDPGHEPTQPEPKPPSESVVSPVLDDDTSSRLDGFEELLQSVVARQVRWASPFLSEWSGVVGRDAKTLTRFPTLSAGSQDGLEVWTEELAAKHEEAATMTLWDTVGKLEEQLTAVEQRTCIEGEVLDGLHDSLSKWEAAQERSDSNPQTTSQKVPPPVFGRALRITRVSCG